MAEQERDGDLDEERVADATTSPDAQPEPEEHPKPVTAPPIPRDPPAPPGYVDPIEQSDLLDAPFAAGRGAA